MPDGEKGTRRGFARPDIIILICVLGVSVASLVWRDDGVSVFERATASAGTVIRAEAAVFETVRGGFGRLLVVLGRNVKITKQSRKCIQNGCPAHQTDE